jgi:hypothetical protein
MIAMGIPCECRSSFSNFSCSFLQAGRLAKAMRRKRGRNFIDSKVFKSRKHIFCPEFLFFGRFLKITLDNSKVG